MRKLLSSVLMFALMLCLFSVPAMAKEPAAPEFTIKDAIECALKQSDDIKSSEVDIDKSWEQRKDAAENVTYTPAMPGSGPVLPDVEAAFNGLVQADLAWRSKKKDMEKNQEQVALAAYKAYVAVLQAKDEIDSAKAFVARDEQLLRNARAMQRVGMLSQTQIIGAEAKVNSSRAALGAAQEALDKAYISFNKLVGLWPVDRPVLIDKITYVPIKVDVIETEAQRAIENSKDIWKLEQNITIQKLDLGYLTKSYDVEKHDIESAKITLEGAKKTIRETVHALYKAIRGIEENQLRLVEMVRVKEEELRVANVKFNAGMITKTELTETETELVEAKKSLQDLVYQHNNLVSEFKVLTGKPILEDKNN